MLAVSSFFIRRNKMKDPAASSEASNFRLLFHRKRRGMNPYKQIRVCGRASGRCFRACHAFKPAMPSNLPCFRASHLFAPGMDYLGWSFRCRGGGGSIPGEASTGFAGHRLSDIGRVRDQPFFAAPFQKFDHGLNLGSHAPWIEMIFIAPASGLIEGDP